MPAGHFLVNSLALGELLNSGWHGALEFAAIKLVVSCDLELVKAREHVQLRDVDRVEAVDLVRELHDVQVQPAALTLATGRGAKLVTHCLDTITNLIVEPGGEGASSDTCRISLHNTNCRLYSLGRNSKTSADATDCRGAGGDVGVRAEIDIEHCCVRSFSDDSLLAVDKIFVHVVDTVDDHLISGAIKLFVELTQLVELLLLIKVLNVELLLENVDEAIVLLLEEVPISQITNSEADTESLTGIGGSDTSLRRANHLVLPFGESRGLLHPVSLNLNLRDKVSSVCQLEATFIVDTVLVELRQLFKHRLNVHNNTVAEKILAAGVEDTARQQMESVLVSIGHNSVSCVGAAIEASANVVIFSENVDKFAFAFIAPLGAEDDAEARLETSDARLACSCDRLWES